LALARTCFWCLCLLNACLLSCFCRLSRRPSRSGFLLVPLVLPPFGRRAPKTSNT
jgi:hypothetical protein